MMTNPDPYGTGVVPAPDNPDVLDPYGSTGLPIPETSIRNRRGTAVEWSSANVVLEDGELGFETDTGKFKMGNGASAWSSLPYFVPEPDIVAMITQAVANGGGGTNDPSSLNAHISSPTPHPVYDDGPSLFLLYQNAKV